MPLQRLVSVDCVRDDQQSQGYRSTFELLTFGGCTLEYLGRLLAHYGKTHHYWRHSVMADMARDLPTATIDLGDPVASRTIDRYLNRRTLKIILERDHGAYVFECASDYAFEYLRIGSALIPDIRSDLFREGWSNLSFDGVEELSSAAKVSPDDPQYWRMWLAAFRLFYRDVLAPKVARGSRIFFVRRYLCPHGVVASGMACIDATSIARRNENLRDVYDSLNDLGGIKFIDPPQALLFTSSGSPGGGPWELHPDEEYYTYVGEQILRVMFADQALAHAFRWQRMAAAATARRIAEANVDRLNLLIDDWERRYDDLRKDRDAITTELSGAFEKCEELGRWASTLHTQRDRLFEENQTLLAKLEAANRDIGYLAHKASLSKG